MTRCSPELALAAVRVLYGVSQSPSAGKAMATTLLGDKVGAVSNNTGVLAWPHPFCYRTHLLLFFVVLWSTLRQRWSHLTRKVGHMIVT